jgi:uncharacterized membrane protein
MTHGRLEALFARWQAAGLLDAEQVGRLRAHEAGLQDAPRRRWPTLIALVAGGFMLGTGVLLFVGAQWDSISPAFRFGLVLLMVGVFHAAAVVATGRFDALAVTFRALGTAAFGAGIFLTAQVFNLQSHWPGAFLLWSLGAVVAWVLVREWPQAAFLAVLVPIWLMGEWSVAAADYSGNMVMVPAAGMVLLSLTYLWAGRPGSPEPARRALTLLGSVALIPSVAVLMVSQASPAAWRGQPELPFGLVATGGAAAFLLPLLVAVLLRGAAAWPLLLFALWVMGGMAIPADMEFLGYLWCAVAALGLMAVGVRTESRLDINLGILAFGLTVLAFYSSSVMDRLGRSASLVVGGVLLLAGGWGLDRARRRLLARTPRVAAP